MNVGEGIFYDAKKVVDAMKHGYLQVRFPYGTKDTMIEGSFMIGGELSQPRTSQQVFALNLLICS